MLNQNQNVNNSCKKYRKIGPYLLTKVIGRGAYSTVYEAKKQIQKKRYAIKQTSLLKLNSKQLQRIQLQIKVLTQIKHKNIVCLLDYKQTSRNIYLVFQYCKYTDLQNYIHNYSVGKLSQENVQKIAVQIKNAFQVLRANKVVHRDLKLANILVTQDFQIKISDFGFAKYLDDDQFFKSYVGTPLTMAPQIMFNHSYNQKCDLWSLGIMLYQLLFGRNPFFTKDKMTKFQIKKALKNQLIIPQQVSPLVEDLLKKMIVAQPKQRISFQHFFNHPWLLNQHTDSKLNQNFLQEVLKVELKKIIIMCNKKKQQKQFLLNHIEKLLAYQIIQHVKNLIQSKIMNWINLCKKIISMDYLNHKLSFFGVAVLMQNIEKYQNGNFILFINQTRKLVLSQYNEIRKLQKWEMTQFSKRFPGFIDKSWIKFIQYIRSFNQIINQFQKKELDAKIQQLFLLELTQQIANHLQNVNIQHDLLIFTKIKPSISTDLSIKITSNLINPKTLDMLLQKMNLNIQNNKMYKKLNGIFKLETLYKDYPEDKIYENIKQLLD